MEENSLLKTIEKNSSAEIIEKKSKFIANILKVESVREAEEKINLIKKKYYNAKHNCFAFSVLQENQTILRFSDDGEPQGTAGEVILNVITKNNLNNILIIVTRYFGGILLGTGGLTRAYSNVSMEALNNNNIIYETDGLEEKIEITYENSEKFKRYCDKNSIKIINIEYKENIVYIIEINEIESKKLKEIAEQKNVKEYFNIVSCVTICQKHVKIGK